MAYIRGIVLLTPVTPSHDRRGIPHARSRMFVKNYNGLVAAIINANEGVVQEQENLC
jgi:hypothetical protein